MSDCLCKRIYDYIEFELENEKLEFSKNNTYVTTSTYNNNNKNVLKITVIFEPTENKDSYFCTSEITHFISTNESNNTLIESILDIPNLDEYKDKVHELLSTFLFNSVITSKLIKNIISSNIKDIEKVSQNNTFSIKLWKKENKKYASITTSRV